MYVSGNLHKTMASKKHQIFNTIIYNLYNSIAVYVIGNRQI